MEIASFILVLLGVGVFAGVIAGLLGVGGGIVIVPVLYFVLSALDYPQSSAMHVAVATSLASIVLTSARSVMSHNKRGAVDWDLLRAWAPYLAVSAVIGVVAADALPTRVLIGVFGFLAFLVALNMAFEGARRPREGGGGPLGKAPPEGWIRAAWASAMGFFSALMGIGGGTFGVPLLGLYGTPIHRSVATAAGFGVVIALPSAIGFIIAGLDATEKPPFTLGYVNLAAFAIITPMTVATAPVGVRIAHALDPRPLKLVFAFFLAATALNMLRKAGFS